MTDLPSDDYKLPEGLPPLDQDPDDANGPDRDAAMDELLPGSNEEQLLELDDESAAELDVGVVLHLPIDEAAGDGLKFVFDMKELLNPVDMPEQNATDDYETGPAQFDASIGIDSIPDIVADDSTHGAEEDLAYLVSDELPGLDADDTGDFDDSSWYLADLELNEEPPPWSDARWRERRLPELDAAAAGSCLLVQSGTVVAGGADLIWWPQNAQSPTLLTTHSAELLSVALTGTSTDTLLYSTTVGELLRRRSPVTAPERLSAWRVACGLRDSDPATLRLYPLPDGSGRILALVSSGMVLGSGDAGSSWERIDALQRVVALGYSGTEMLAVTRHHDAARLLRSAGGMDWTSTRLDHIGRRIAEATSPLLAGMGSAVALADEARGLALSNDGGSSFALVDGCVGVTALAAGQLGADYLIWAALYREADDLTELCRVDAATRTAERIAELRAPAATRGEESAEQSRIRAMQWDPLAERLWGVGQFGLTSFVPG